MSRNKVSNHSNSQKAARMTTPNDQTDGRGTASGLAGEANQIVGQPCWITRGVGATRYVLWRKEPETYINQAGFWRGPDEDLIRFIAVKRIKDELGYDPKLKGGPDSIVRGTLYVAFDPDGE